jgi:tetratricopeptide (TPR) repeat protein
MKEGRFREAIEDLNEAMTYPENLGTGRPAFPAFARQYYQIGLCYENMGEDTQAIEFYKKAAGEEAGSSSEQAKYVSLARQKLKKIP